MSYSFDYHDTYPTVHLSDDKSDIILSALIDEIGVRSQQVDIGQLKRLVTVLSTNNEDQETEAALTFSVGFRQAFDRLIEYNTLAVKGEKKVDFVSIDAKETFDVWKAQMQEMIKIIDSMTFYKSVELHEKRVQQKRRATYGDLANVTTKTVVFDSNIDTSNGIV